MTPWEREEVLTQDIVPLHEKGGLELMIRASRAAPPVESSQVFTCSALGCRKGAGSTRGSIKPLADVWCSVPKF